MNFQLAYLANKTSERSEVVSIVHFHPCVKRGERKVRVGEMSASGTYGVLARCTSQYYPDRSVFDSCYFSDRKGEGGETSCDKLDIGNVDDGENEKEDLETDSVALTDS